MRSKTTVEKEYNRLRLKNIALNNKMDDYAERGDPFHVNTEYEELANEEEQTRHKMFVLAWVLGYTEHL